jgi:hypothetical protein
MALTPSGTTVPLPAGEGHRYLPLEEHGFYTVRPPGIEPERPFVIAVNVDLEESNLARLDAEELGAQLMAPPGAQGGSLNVEAAASLQMEDQERRQSLWRWLLLAALALFVVETALSNWVSRRQSGAQAALSG